MNFWTTIDSVINALSAFAAQNSGELIAGFGGAFFGALSAYIFEQRRERAKLKDERHSAILNAQLTLIYHINSLQNVQRSFLDPHRNTPNRETALTYFHQAINELSVDIKSLGFLLTSLDANVLMDVYIADRAFSNALDAVRIRNQELERFLASSKVIDFDIDSGAAQVEADLPRLKFLRDVTDAMYSSVDSSLKKNEAALSALKKSGKKVFPRRKFLRFEDIPLDSSKG